MNSAGWPSSSGLLKILPSDWTILVQHLNASMLPVRASPTYVYLNTRSNEYPLKSRDGSKRDRDAGCV